FLYGGDTGVAERLKEVLVQRFPGLRIVGTFSPPFRLLTAREEAELTLRLSELRPDIFWVGLSTPKQERFMAKYMQEWDMKVMLGIPPPKNYGTRFSTVSRVQNLLLYKRNRIRFSSR